MSTQHKARTTWLCNGRVVTVSPTADIPAPFRNGQSRADLLQAAFDQVEPWAGSDGVMKTVKLTVRVPAIIVPLNGRTPTWAKHVGHHARQVQVSPFVKLAKPALTDDFTVELTGRANQPRLVRAYPGGYAPPLPWQGSARHVPGGVDTCTRFWRTHAYVLTESNTVSGSNIGSRAPSWFKVR